MVLFAVSDAVWLAIVGVITLTVKEYFDRERARDAAKKVDVVKETLVTSTAAQERKLDNIGDKVEVVHKATNSMKDELVALTAKSSFAEGEKAEKDKQHGDESPAVSPDARAVAGAITEAAKLAVKASTNDMGGKPV